MSAQGLLGSPEPSPADQVPKWTVVEADPTSPSSFAKVTPLPQGLGRPSQLGRAGQEGTPTCLPPFRYTDHQDPQTRQEWMLGRQPSDIHLSCSSYYFVFYCIVLFYIISFYLMSLVVFTTDLLPGSLQLFFFLTSLLGYNCFTMVC